MKPSEDLFKLIKSLTKAEKIHFKKFSKRHILGEGNKYVKLFDVIDKQEKKYDESKVKESFKGDRFVNQIHVAKNYLSEIILRSLSDQYSEKEIDFTLFEQLKKIRILIDKNLPGSALKQIRKTKKLAEENYNYSALNYLYEFECLITARKYTIEAYKELKKLVNIKNENLNQLSNTSQYKSYNLILNLISARWSYSKNKDDLKAIKEILEIPLIKNEDLAKGFSSKYELYGIKLRAYRFLIEDDKSLYYRKKVVELMEEYPETIDKYPERYIARIHDLIIFILGTENTKPGNISVEEYFIKLKNYMDIILKSNKSETTKSLSWQAYYQLRIGYYYSTLKKDEFNEIMKTVRSEITIYQKSLRLRYLFDFYLYIIVAYFEFEEYEQSLTWLTKYINHKDAQKYEELYNTMLMFSIILHYELGNYEFAESLLNKTKRYYKKKEKLYETEKVLLSYLRSLLSANTDSPKKIFKDLSDELEILSQKETEKRFLNAFDFRRWVSKKL